jgi:hypothetical protein
MKFTDIITVSDNKTACIIRVIGLGAFLFGCLMIGDDVMFNKGHFDYKEFEVGTAALITSIGAAIYMKRYDEPGRRRNDSQ